MYHCQIMIKFITKGREYSDTTRQEELILIKKKTQDIKQWAYKILLSTIAGLKYIHEIKD
jgi:hypothetical protein